MSRTRTVGEVIAAMVNEIQGSSGSSGSSGSFSSAPAPAPAAAPSSSGGSSGGAAEATRVVMEVLASKTGYDTEMIEDDMELETELGIDSIKRVEILSEVQSRLNVEAKDIAALSRTRTVGEVIAAMVNEIKGTSNSSQKGTYILPE